MIRVPRHDQLTMTASFLLFNLAASKNACLAFAPLPSLATRKHTLGASRSHNGRVLVRRKALIPLEVDELKSLLSTGAPTASQYSTYWGRNSKERYAKWNESALVMLLGTLFSYCLSFIFGSFVATLLGVVCFTWAILGPEIEAYQRNWEFLGGRSLVDPWIVDGDENRQGLYGALFLGRVSDISVVEDSSARVEYDIDDFQDYTMEYDPLERATGMPYLLRVKFEDNEGRTLQAHARLSEEYLDLEVGQPAAGVLLSTSQSFISLAALTDFVVPDAQCWIGDYPYLDRPALEQLLVEDEVVWETFQLEEEGAVLNEPETTTFSTVVEADERDISRDKVTVGRRRGRRRLEY
jgi:hypothetical protein